MRMLKHLSALAALGALLLVGPFVSPASAVGTTGTWTQYPTGATEYQAVVQQPINSANTSNWSSKSKGGIPVMFQLQSRTGPAAFQSIFSDGTDPNPATTNDYSYVSFAPNPTLTFNGITTLKTDYSFIEGDCGGGSLRWSVRVDVGNDGITSNDGSVFIYYGEEPNTIDCTTNNQSGVNMIGQPDLRYDTSQVGGTFYDTYAHAQALVGTDNVRSASLVIDSGWFHTNPDDGLHGDQLLNISNTTVNDNVYQFVSSGGGAFTTTCNLPAATIDVGKSDPVVNGDINEATVQASLSDSGSLFRVVDCKYQYVLSIPSLSGTGTYFVEIKINDVVVPTPLSSGGKVKFDLK